MSRPQTIDGCAIDLGLREANCAIENCWGALHARGDLKRAIHHAKRARHWLDLAEQLARASAAQPSAIGHCSLVIGHSPALRPLRLRASVVKTPKGGRS